MKRLFLVTALVLSGCYESTEFTLLDNPYPVNGWSTTRDGVWEQFNDGEFDLGGYSIVFTPQRGATTEYEWAAIPLGGFALPFEPGSGSSTLTLALGDDDYERYSLRERSTLYFFGQPNDEIFVSSNGYVSFGVSEANQSRLTSLSSEREDHFLFPSVAVMRGDLDPSERGSVVVDEWRNRVVISWVDVPRYSEGGTSHNCQIVLHANGVIELHYAGVRTSRRWIVGLSNGLEGAYPAEANFVGGSSVSEHCGDGVDNDGDGWVDCEDPDCATDTTYCWPDWEDNCWDGWDNDGDGWVDCEDPDCDEECWEEWEFDCWDGWDNDGDGLIDCDDPDCYEECEWIEFDCSDGRDNDGDGWVDCADPDCERSEECFGERDCYNGVDDDRDGYVDCEDADCFGEPGCESTCRGYWQRFDEPEAVDVDGNGIYLNPVGEMEPNFYELGTFPVEPYWVVEPGSSERTTMLDLADDDWTSYRFQSDFEFPFFGQYYDLMYVSSNGYISFGRGSSSLSSDPSELFSLPTIAALRGDLNPMASGRVIVDQFDWSALVVTYDSVPWFSGDRPNSFQIILNATGEIEIYYVEVAEERSAFIIGVSNGCDSFEYPPESDFFTSERCDDRADNDGDGLIDCWDPDCFGVEPYCVTEEACADGADNDLDGLADCDDPDCAFSDACRDRHRGYWELFDVGEPIDLEGSVIYFTPDDTAFDGYEVYYEEGVATEYLEEPGAGMISSRLSLSDDSFSFYDFTLMRPGFPFYGELYESFFVSSNGYVTFESGSGFNGTTPEQLFALDTVAGYRSDLNPAEDGSVYVDEYPDHVTVTFDEVPFWSYPGSANSFQFALFTDGSIILFYRELSDDRAAILGVASGEGRSFPPETNFIP